MAWEQIRNKPEGFYHSIDGFTRSKAAEIELNADIAALFKTELGKLEDDDQVDIHQQDPINQQWD